jgi:pimeloyl-ACP methyl ester carboxylesterase
MSEHEPMDVWFPISDGAEFQLHGESVGEGSPTLVFLHYWGGSSRTWRGVASRLAGSYRCVAYEHRGWGRSGSPDAGFAIVDLASDALAVIDALEPAEVVLVGHSMGGKVAQAVAARKPHRLRGLVLVAPAPAAPAVTFDDAARQELLSNYQSPESVRRGVENVIYQALAPEVMEQIVADSLAGIPAATAAWPMGAISEDVSAGVGEIEVPVLVVGADHDGVEPVDLLRDHVVAALPNARLVVVTESGHFIPLEQPYALAEEIRSFVASLG